MAQGQSTFGDHLRELRKAKHMGLRELAAKAEISPAFLSKVERGKEKPPAEKKLRALARALGQDEEKFVLRSGRIPDLLHSRFKDSSLDFPALVWELSIISPKKLEAIRKITRMASTFSVAEAETFLDEVARITQKSTHATGEANRESETRPKRR